MGDAPFGVPLNPPKRGYPQRHFYVPKLPRSLDNPQVALGWFILLMVFEPPVRVGVTWVQDGS